MLRSLPLLAWLLGLAGVIPFAACGVLALTAGVEDRGAFALVAYGAVILAFLGGVHWGFAIPEPSSRGERARLGLGVLPSLAGWVALLLSLAVGHWAALAVLIVSFAGLIVVEARAARAGLVPPGYLRLRYVLSGLVLTVLVVVLVLRLAGTHLGAA